MPDNSPADLLELVDSSYIVAALALAFAAAVVNGFRQLAGTSTPSERKRRPGQSATAWLLGDAMASRCRFDLPGYRIACTHTAAEPDEWDVTVPPPLSAAGSSHLWLGRLGRLIFPDVVIRIPDIAIPAPPSEVWSILIDFERYGEWNGFHRRMQVVDRPGGIVGLRMTVELGPLLGIVVETNKVYYLDEKRHILVYGVRGDEGPSSMRVAWIEPAADGGCTFRSYDTIGGWPALLSRGHIRNEVWIGFNEQHQALRDRVLALRRAAAKPTRSLGDFVGGPDALGVCLVTGGRGFLGRHLVQMLASLSGVAAVHAVDLAPPPPRAERGVEHHRVSITDAAALEELVARVKPQTIFHVAAIIDLRPEAAVQRVLDAVNVDATAHLLELARRHGARRFVYTSTLEAAYHGNKCVDATEANTPYMAHPENGYQRTKIAAERSVLLAADAKLHTVVVRPAHIYGAPPHDEVGKFVADAPVAFGEGHWLPRWGARGAAIMSMVHVENCALGHVLAASQASRPDVSGRAFYVEDFAENIVCLYRALAGKRPPLLCLPYWLLWILVSAALLAHAVVRALTFGHFGAIGGKMGLHNGALAAGRQCTVSSARARDVLGYRSEVTRDDAIGGAGQQAPLLAAEKVAAAVARACR